MVIFIIKYFLWYSLYMLLRIILITDFPWPVGWTENNIQLAARFFSLIITFSLFLVFEELADWATHRR